MGIKSHLRAGSFGFSDKLCCLGLILAENYAQFPNSSLPTGIHGYFGGQQIVEGFVAICPELQFIHWGSHASSPGNSNNWGNAGKDVSREASVALTLAWDEVSSGWGGPLGFWDGVVGTTTGVGLLRDECSDPQLDTSSTAQKRMFLTSVVILLSDLGGTYADWPQ